MSARKIIEKDGVRFKLFAKSIIIEGVPGAIYYNRMPEMKDVEVLLTAIQFGKELFQEEARQALENFNNVFTKRFR